MVPPTLHIINLPIRSYHDLCIMKQQHASLSKSKRGRHVGLIVVSSTVDKFEHMVSTMITRA